MYNNIKNTRALYIEDDEVISIHFMAILEKLGAKVSHAPDYDDAMKFAKTGEYDYIISDIRLPNGLGLDVIKFVRMVNEDIPVIITSGYAETDYLLDAIEYNVSKYFIKPFKQTELFEYVDRLMEKKNIVQNISALPSDAKELNDGCAYSMSAKALFKNGIEIKLSIQEIALIELLLKKRGKVVGYEELQKVLSKNDDKITIDTLRTVIKNIRKKSSEYLISTQSGLGYKIS